MGNVYLSKLQIIGGELGGYKAPKCQQCFWWYFGKVTWLWSNCEGKKQHYVAYIEWEGVEVWWFKNRLWSL